MAIILQHHSSPRSTLQEEVFGPGGDTKMRFFNIELLWAWQPPLNWMNCPFKFQVWFLRKWILNPCISLGVFPRAVLKGFLNGTMALLFKYLRCSIIVSVVHQSCQMTCLIYSQLFTQVCIRYPPHHKWEGPGQVRDLVIITWPLLLLIKIHNSCCIWLIKVIILILLNMCVTYLKP